MNIGDRVRLLHSKEQGIIVGFKSGDIIEVEIEDGFKLPILKRELAVISAYEDKAFKAAPAVVARAEEAKTKGVVAEKGLFVAFQPSNDRDVVMFLINNTDWDLPFMLSTGSERYYRGLAGGFLMAKTHVKITELSTANFDAWGTFTFQALFYSFGYIPERAPFVKRFKCRADTFFKNKKKAPILDKEAYLFQLDADVLPQNIVVATVEPAVTATGMPATPAPQTPIIGISPEKLRENMLERNTRSAPVLAQQFQRPTAVIDLHIEQLTKDFMTLNNAQMLEMQLVAFNKQLEQGIASGMDFMTFIHGVGNGTLRTEIQRCLSKHPNVAYFEDAQKEKFGYGATRAKIK